MSQRSPVLRWPFLAAFVALVLVLHEAHELAHTVTGRLLCGGWGPRDFNVWQLPEGCAAWLPTLAGPVLSFAVLWIGFSLLRRGPDARRSLGVALVMAANPFARLFTAAMGGGDEGVLVRAWLDVPRGPIATVVTLAGVAALAVPPLIAAWRAMPRPGRPVAYVVLLLLPMVATGVLLFAALNPVLARGVLADPVVAGTPLLVWLVTIGSVIAAVALHRRLTVPLPAATTP